MRILRGVRFAAHLGLELHLRKEETIVRREYGTAGYAHITDAEREAIHFLARTEGILVDPVYTGRALAGLLDLVRTVRQLITEDREVAGDRHGAQVLRTYGTGAQILRDLGVTRMRVLSAPKQMQAISGFGLEVVEYVDDAD